MTNKQLEQIGKVLNGEKYTKKWDFWATLSRQDIVKVTARLRPRYGIESVEITDWGKIVYADAIDEKRGENK